MVGCVRSQKKKKNTMWFFLWWVVGCYHRLESSLTFDKINRSTYCQPASPWIFLCLQSIVTVIKQIQKFLDSMPSHSTWSSWLRSWILKSCRLPKMKQKKRRERLNRLRTSRLDQRCFSVRIGNPCNLCLIRDPCRFIICSGDAWIVLVQYSVSNMAGCYC